jgi:hypothetical protein
VETSSVIYYGSAKILPKSTSDAMCGYDIQATSRPTILHCQLFMVTFFRS